MVYRKERAKVHFPTLLTHILLYINLSIKANENTLFFSLFCVKFYFFWRFFPMEPFGLLNFIKILQPLRRLWRHLPLHR